MDDFNSWLNIALFIGALLVHAVVITVFMYKEFVTKRELTALERHFEIMLKQESLNSTTKLQEISRQLSEMKEEIRANRRLLTDFITGVKT